MPDQCVVWGCVGEEAETTAGEGRPGAQPCWSSRRTVPSQSPGNYRPRCRTVTAVSGSPPVTCSGRYPHGNGGVGLSALVVVDPLLLAYVL